MDRDEAIWWCYHDIRSMALFWFQPDWSTPTRWCGYASGNCASPARLASRLALPIRACSANDPDERCSAAGARFGFPHAPSAFPYVNDDICLAQEIKIGKASEREVCRQKGDEKPSDDGCTDVRAGACAIERSGTRPSGPAPARAIAARPRCNPPARLDSAGGIGNRSAGWPGWERRLRG